MVPCLLLSGCYALMAGPGGGVPDPPTARAIDPADVAVPAGFAVEVVATGLTFPTGITFDDQGRIYVVESGYSYGEVFTRPQVLVLGEDRHHPVVVGDNPPWTGATWHDGALVVSEGGVIDGGRVLRIPLGDPLGTTPDAEPVVLVDDLPSLGDHHTNAPVVGPDGYVYFGQGTASNAGVVGRDNAAYGWLARHPDFHDVPCEDIVLAGTNFRTGRRGARVVWTGAYAPYDTMTSSGQVIEGDPRCGGSVLRVPVGGGDLEVFAWGMRNPFGLAFHRDGTLYATDNGYDRRGSRPIFGAPDFLREVAPGSWHGWPEFSGTDPVARSRFAPPGEDPPLRILSRLPARPTPPVASFGVHASANGLDFSPGGGFGSPDTVYVAMFGDMAPAVGEVIDPVGYKVVRVNVRTGLVEDFLANRGDKVGPASWLDTAGVERPIAVRFDPAGRAMYVVDFGVVGMSPDGTPLPVEGTGAVFKVTAVGGPLAGGEG